MLGRHSHVLSYFKTNVIFKFYHQQLSSNVKTKYLIRQSICLRILLIEIAQVRATKYRQKKTNPYMILVLTIMFHYP